MNTDRIYISHLLPDDSMRQLVSETSAGVESIEFGIPDSLDRWRDSIRQYECRLERIGADHLSVHGPFLDLNPASYDSKIRRATMERFAAAYDAAIELDASRIVFHSCMNPSIHCEEGWAEQMESFFREFLKDRSGLPIFVENVLDPRPEPLAEFVKRLDHPDVKLCLDLGHAHCYTKADVLEWFSVLEPWLGHLHIHDNGGDRDAHLAAGEGTIPWEDILPMIRRNPNLTCTVECNSEESVRKTCSMLQGV